MNTNAQPTAPAVRVPWNRASIHLHEVSAGDRRGILHATIHHWGWLCISIRFNDDYDSIRNLDQSDVDQLHRLPDGSFKMSFSREVAPLPSSIHQRVQPLAQPPLR